jgi:hypothetical protein
VAIGRVDVPVPEVLAETESDGEVAQTARHSRQSDCS